MPGSPATRIDLSELLHRTFGHREFRPHQREVCEAAAAGRDVLLVMPTGAGKSLCYQLPALALAAEGERKTALVISPLIALMDDQASKLLQLGLRVARIHSGRAREESRQACRDYLAGELDFLFIAPERLRVPGFPEMLAKRKPALVAIDEAHCISQWGHDFRPDYRTLGQYLPALRPAPIIGLTATATPQVQQDIARQLGLQDPATFITGFRRHNLAVEVVELSKAQRPDFALKLLQNEAARPAIIYAGSRKQAEEFADKLSHKFPTAPYHAGLDAGTRDRVQRAFLSGKLDVVVATVAFGMGVDKADVRTVLHVALPGSLEAYYQEIGRAGRDGKPSRTILLHNFSDRKLQDFLLEKSFPPTADLERTADILPPVFTPIDEIQRALRMDRETLERVLEKLLATGVAQMDSEGNVRFAEGAQGGGRGGPRWQDAYDALVTNRRGQIERMIAFTEGTNCRMLALVRHFGDRGDSAKACGLCDICNPAGAQGGTSAHQPSAQERTQLRRLLGALEKRSTSTGKLFTDAGVTRDRGEFDALLEGLARAGLVAIANDTFTNPEGREVTYRKVSVTHEGREPDDRTLDTVWIRGAAGEGEARPARKRGGAAREGGGGTPRRSRAAEPAELSGEAQALFEKLRAWRTEVARPTKTPAFLILSDAVLRSIAQRAPRNLVELTAIPGIGDSKLDKYGAGILAVTRGAGEPQVGAASGSAARAEGAAARRDDRQLRGERERPGTAQLAFGRQNADAEVQRRAAPVPLKAEEAAAQRRTAPVGTKVRSVEGEPRRRAEAPEGREGVSHPLYAPGRPVKQRAPEPTAGDAPLTAEQQAFAERLRGWRAEAAREAGLPSFFVLSDTALVAVARAMPRDADDLSRIAGLGSEKIKSHGQSILRLARTR